MTTTLSYGATATCRLALGDCTVLAPNSADHPSVDDPAAVVRAALAAPRDYPPLAAALAPGDLVTIALGRGIPQLEAVLDGAIAALTACGVTPSEITVLSADPLAAHAQLAADLAADGVTYAVHDPDDEDSIAMLGMTAEYRPLRMNRTLTEADFVLPIMVARSGQGGASPEKFAGLFPRFSNRETADRIQGRGDAPSPLGRTKRAAESDEAGWLLGVGMAVVVVPGPDGGVAAVEAGDPAAATLAAATMFTEIWERAIDERGELAIGAIPGDADQQTWGNLARAVSACSRVVRPGCAIAVCCEVEEPPSGSYESLVDAVDLEKVAAKLRKSHAADARPALVLAQAVERGPVYLRSLLPDDVVESLGMAPIASDAELARLAAGRPQVVVIQEAQRLKPRYVGEPDDLE
jgi:hypothetical protein